MLNGRRKRAISHDLGACCCWFRFMQGKVIKNLKKKGVISVSSPCGQNHVAVNQCHPFLAVAAKTDLKKRSQKNMWFARLPSVYCSPAIDVIPLGSAVGKVLYRASPDL